MVQKKGPKSADQEAGFRLRALPRLKNKRQRNVVPVNVVRGEVGPNKNRKRNARETGSDEHAGLDGVQTGNDIGGEDPDGLVQNAENNDAHEHHGGTAEEVYGHAAAEVGQDDDDQGHLDPEQNNKVADGDVADGFW